MDLVRHEPGSSLYYGIQMLRIFLVATMLLLCQCGSTEKPAPKPASQPAAAPAPPAAAADTRPAIVCFGDSITAGFGLDAGQSFPDLLQQDLDGRAIHYRVVNLGVSGDTTQDGLARLTRGDAPLDPPLDNVVT